MRFNVTPAGSEVLMELHEARPGWKSRSKAVPEAKSAIQLELYSIILGIASIARYWGPNACELQ